MNGLLHDIRKAGDANRVAKRQRRRKRRRRDYSHVSTSRLENYLGEQFYNESQIAFGKFDFKECVIRAEQLGLRMFICGRDDVGKKIYTFGNSLGFSPIESYKYATIDLEGRQIVRTCNDFQLLKDLEFGWAYAKNALEGNIYFNRGKYHIVRHLGPFRTFYNRDSQTYFCQGRTFMAQEKELLLENILLDVFDDQYWTVRHILEYCMDTVRHALIVHQYNHVTFLVEAPLEECYRIVNGKEKRVLPVGQNVTVAMTRISKLLEVWTEEMEDRKWNAQKIKKLMKNQDSVHDAILANKKPSPPPESAVPKLAPGLNDARDADLKDKVQPSAPNQHNGASQQVGVPGVPAGPGIDLEESFFRPNLPVAPPGLADSFGGLDPESPMPPNGPPPFVGAPPGWKE